MKRTFLFLLIVFCFAELRAQISKTFFIDKNGERETVIKTLINPINSRHGLESDKWSIEVHYPSGQMKREGMYSSGLWNGMWKRYAPNGALFFEGQFSNGKAIGVHKYYSLSGKLKQWSFWESGSGAGTTILFGEPGDTTAIKEFNHGELVKQKFFYENATEEVGYASWKRNGIAIKRNKMGIIIEKGNYHDGYKIGKWICYNDDGLKTSTYVFSDTDTSKFIQANNPCQTYQNIPYRDGSFWVTDTMPEFPGGDNGLLSFIQQKVEYPVYCRDNDIQSRVIISFEVSETGEVEYVIPIRAEVYSELTEEAIRVVELLPKFKPGAQSGKKVRVLYSLPITFKLQ